jgi:transmembrane sensor
METNNYEELLEKYRLGQCSAAEIRQLEAWYADWNAKERVMLSEADLNRAELLMRDEVMGRTAVRKLIPWRGLSIAASITLVIGLGLFYFNRTAPNVQNRVAKAIPAERIVPGKQGATLTLANGTKIKLSDVQNGVLAKQAGINISKTAGGSLIYELKHAEGKNSDGLQGINTLSTENGETYQLRLPDGSLAVLNAASSLTYSAGLVNNGKRVVKLTGEAYFEVAKDARHPFIVESNGQQVQVLGTHFNVNSYADEDVQRTTLLEGSVKVTSGNRSAVIAPGQQVRLSNGALSTETVDVSQAVAWKDGLFNFNSSDIQNVMRQLARWYNVTVEYEGAIPKDKITGKVHRDADLSQALTILKYLDIHYVIKDRTIIIKP